MEWSVVQADALEWLRSLPDGHADLCVTSPPYTSARTYGIKAARRSAEWVAWMRPIIVEACRVARLVALNVSDQVQGFRYGCADLWLIADLTRLDGLALGPAPYAWVRPGIPGSGSDHYHRRNWEPVYLLARPENLPPNWSDNTAFGTPPVFGIGGDPTNRRANGDRVSDPWKKNGRGNNLGGRNLDGSKKRGTGVGDSRRSNGEFKRKKKMPSGSAGGDYTHRDGILPDIANPGNVIYTRNGGGLLGHALAHENEAPMNLALAERFVCWFCPPAGRVIDMFSGSGTTAHAAKKWGRSFAGCDVRESQVDLSRRRLATVTTELFV